MTGPKAAISVTPLSLRELAHLSGVRLYSCIDETWTFVDYSYTAPAPSTWRRWSARRRQRAVRGRSDLQMDGRLRCGSLQTFHRPHDRQHRDLFSGAEWTVGQCFRAWARRPDYLGPPVFIARWCLAHVDYRYSAANPDGIAHIVDPPHGCDRAGGRGTYPSTINVKLTWEEERTSPITSYPIPIITGITTVFRTIGYLS